MRMDLQRAGGLGSSADTLRTFHRVRRWNEIERAITDNGAGPWFMAINEGNPHPPAFSPGDALGMPPLPA